MGQLARTAEEYDYRRFQPGDMPGFLDLYESVWGHTRDREWAKWRFLDNPYLDDVLMVVAEGDDGLVGAEPCLAFRLAVDGHDVLALQPADWMVHPDHRRRGVFTSMTEMLVERWAGGPADLYFNFPTPVLQPGLRKFGWRIGEETETYCRIQQPDTFLSDGVSKKSPLPPAVDDRVARAATLLVRGYVRARTRRHSPAPGLSIEKHGSIPVDLLVDLYESDPPDAIHVRHDADFYRWRFSNPRWETTTYVASRGGAVEAACVTCTETRAGVRRTGLVDVLPRGDLADPDAYRAILESVVEDARDSDVLKVSGGAIPSAVLGEFGFWSNGSFPLSALSTRSRLAVRPTTDREQEPWLLAGRDPADVDQWSLPLADQDVG